MKMCSRGLLVSVLIVTAFSMSGCAGSAPKVPELSRPPFEMPDGFPLPDDGKVTFRTKALKGGSASVSFRTKKSFDELIKFYREKLIPFGLVEDEILYKSDHESFNLSFYGWPHGKKLSINGNSSQVEASLWSRRKELPFPPPPKLRPVRIRKLFQMPKEFPVPADASDVSRYKPEDSEDTAIVEFITRLSKEEVLDYYRKLFSEYGVTEDTGISHLTEDGLSTQFEGWPGGRILFMSVQDLAYTFDTDVRRVNFQYKKL